MSLRSRIITEGKRRMESVQDELNVLGKDGWELVSVQNIRLEDSRLARAKTK